MADQKTMEGRILKALIVFFAIILGIILNGFSLVIKDQSLSWLLFFLVPGLISDIWLTIGAFKVLYKDYSN